MLQFSAVGVGPAAIFGEFPICYGNFLIDPLTLMNGPYHAQATLMVVGTDIALEGIGVTVMVLNFYGTQHGNYLGNLSFEFEYVAGIAMMEAPCDFKTLGPLPPPQPPPGWDSVAGSLKQVSVASDGTVWGVNEGDNIYRYRGGGSSGSSPWETH